MTDTPPLDFGDDDVFAVPGPRTGRGQPDTSRRAADKVRPAVPAIRNQILAWALAKGSDGFSDEQLSELDADERRVDRSFIPRRAELADEKLLIDTGRRVRNKRGNQCVVWVHRDHVVAAPAVQERAKASDRGKVTGGDVKAQGKVHYRQLLQFADSMQKEGRGMLATALKDAAEVMRQLSI